MLAFASVATVVVVVYDATVVVVANLTNVDVAVDSHVLSKTIFDRHESVHTRRNYSPTTDFYYPICVLLIPKGVASRRVLLKLRGSFWFLM